MAMSLNRAELIGNLTKEPEVKQMTDGRELALFSIATNRSYKTDDGEKKEIPEYHNIVVYGKLVEVVSKYVRKGHKVWIEGRLQTRSWEAKDGSKRYSTEIVLQQLIMLSGKRDDNEENYSPSKQPAKKYQADVDEVGEVEVDDLPF